MKTQYLVCCSLLLLLSSLLVVQALQIACWKNANRNKKCGKVEKFREDTKFITAMQEKRLAQVDLPQLVPRVSVPVDLPQVDCESESERKRGTKSRDASESRQKNYEVTSRLVPPANIEFNLHIVGAKNWV
ncbi:hypothetical protein P5673_009590 [Acropora cervicornis]|uniref:Uncharacterized protein n=1 Tax=Acropora cervicornis TaxID=6130 RepID=A0AAD9QRI8_ACRCE|nr:hypothetical protein P5673_009590 [Acropora cervicornis]